MFPRILPDPTWSSPRELLPRKGLWPIYLIPNNVDLGVLLGHVLLDYQQHVP